MSDNLATFYLVRHGETDWNKEGILQGQTDTLLNDLGVVQAKEAAELLKNVTFDLAFSSDLLRAKHTAEIIASEHNLTVETTKLLRERNFGSLTGKQYKIVKNHFTKMISIGEHERKKYRVVADAENDEELTAKNFYLSS